MRIQHMFTAEDDQRIREMWGRDFTLREIATVFGMTKNQICGRASRLGLKKKTPVAAGPRAESIPVTAESTGRVLTPAGPIRRYAHVVGTVRTCRWIDGDVREPGWSICGATVRVGSSYCPDHHARCYMPPAPPRMVAAE